MGVDLPLNLKREIFVFAQRITKGARVKLVEEKNLHLTLVFLGEIEKKKVDKVKALLAGIKVGEIELSLDRVEIFPSKTSPQLIWIRVRGQTGKLFSLYKQTIDGFLGQGFILKKNALQFLPHITIARIKAGGVRAMEGELVKGKFTVKKITLFKSQLTSTGPRYLKIGEFAVK